MLLPEFLDRVPECSDEDYERACKMYMALPNMDKDDFCMLFRADEVLGTEFLEPLRTLVEEYEAWVKNKPFFVAKVPMLHEQGVAETMERELMSNLQLLRKVVGQG